MRKVLAELWLLVVGSALVGGIGYGLYSVPDARVPALVTLGIATAVVLTVWAAAELDDGGR